jgi:hypothetical protein
VHLAGKVKRTVIHVKLMRVLAGQKMRDTCRQTKRDSDYASKVCYLENTSDHDVCNQIPRVCRQTRDAQRMVARLVAYASLLHSINSRFYGAQARLDGALKP